MLRSPIETTSSQELTVKDRARLHAHVQVPRSYDCARKRDVSCLSVPPFGFSCRSEHARSPVPENLGVVSFGTSCQPGVQKDFERGVALLHSFAYSAAEASFGKVAEKDPHCAIAHWGVAMTYFHQLWDPPIRQDTIPQGREEIRRAQEIGGGTDRERGFIRALSFL